MHALRNGPSELAEILAQVHPVPSSYITVGVFDGVHRGHQQIIGEMVEAAQATRAAAIAITFAPHPGASLGFQAPPLLTAVDERTELLAALGLDAVILLPFTPATASTSATEFVALLLQHLNLATLWGGPDFAFGHRREGTVPFLQRLGAEHGFTVRIIEPLMWEGAPVNSSRVRAALQGGDIAEASGCLGRPYRLTGEISSAHVERHPLGGLVARLSSPAERLVPAAGVYAGVVMTENQHLHRAVIRVSTPSHPTGGSQVVEVHMFEEIRDIQGRQLAFDFIARLRDDRPFPTSSARMEQTRQDLAQARDLLGEAPSTTG